MSIAGKTGVLTREIALNIVAIVVTVITQPLATDSDL